MSDIRIYENESGQEMAYKIYYEFEVGKSVTIRGEEWTGMPKGEFVLDVIRKLDHADNCAVYRGRVIRKRKRHDNSIGGDIAHKIFRFVKTIDDNKIPKYQIWRVQ